MATVANGRVSPAKGGLNIGILLYFKFISLSVRKKNVLTPTFRERRNKSDGGRFSMPKRLKCYFQVLSEEYTIEFYF